MRKLFILTTFICSLMMSSVAHAEWTKVSESEDGNISYVNFDRIRKHNGKVLFWRLTDLSTPFQLSGTSIFSTKQYMEAECGTFRDRYLKAYAYSTQMGEGTHSFEFNSQKDWNYPDPGSMHEVALNSVCNHKP